MAVRAHDTPMMCGFGSLQVTDLSQLAYDDELAAAEAAAAVSGPPLFCQRGVVG